MAGASEIVGRSGGAVDDGIATAEANAAPSSSPEGNSVPQESSPPRVRPITWLAIAQAIGITIGWQQPRPLVWPWFAVFAIFLVIAAITPGRQPRRRLAAICIAVAGLGAGWVAQTQEYVGPDDLAAWTSERPTLVKLEGVALGPPVLKPRTTGSMARFDHRPPATYFPLKVDHVWASPDAAKPMRGEVLVRVDETMPPFQAGDQVIASGMLIRPSPPRNPGEFDYRRYAKSLGQAGILAVERRSLVEVTSAPRGSIQSTWLAWRDALRRRAGAWLLADLPDIDRRRRDALLANLMLGERDAEIDAIYESFQRVGLAHILAISGFHLSVLAASVLGLARLLTGFRRWHAWLVIAVVLGYLVLVEAHMPVLRAAVMTIAACLGLAAGRRLQGGGLVSLSAILLLFWRPDQLFNPGFQLTYGVVLALIHLTGPVRERWFGPVDHEASTLGQMLGEWLKTAAAVSATAWLVATPIAMFHFGIVSPLGAPLSLIAVPLSAFILALGYVKIVLSAILPSLALMIGAPLSIGSDLLLSIVMMIDRLPLSMVHVPYPSASWSVAAVGWACWWAASPTRRWQRRHWLALGVLLLWLCWPLLPVHARPTLRIDMLSVGDGSCYVLRSGGRAAVFDAGSSTDLAVGTRSLIPAMRRLGVRSIDFIAVSHADLDHFSAVLELAEEFQVGEVRLTPQFIREARSLPEGAAAFLIDGLTKLNIGVRPAAAGDAIEFGATRWTWLNPPPDKTYDAANDGSMVIRIEAPEARRVVMLCGDIQIAAMRSLLGSGVDLRADVTELPHHGSRPRGAEQFTRAVGPAVVMQSTGWKRFSNDKWAQELAATERLVTVRDGASWVEIGRDGAITTGRFLSQTSQRP